MKIEVEGRALEELLASDLGVPCGEEFRGLAVVDPVGVFGEVAFFGDDIEAAKQRQPLVGDEGHDVAFALQRPELERQAGAQSVGCRDHLRSGKASSLSEFVELKAEEVWHKEEEAAAAGGELPRSQGEVGAVGDWLDGGPRAVRSFFVEASGQGGKPLLLEHLTDGGGTEPYPLFAEGLADLIHGVILLPERHNAVVGGRLLRLTPGARMGDEEKLGIGVAAELMAEAAERAGGVAELASDFARGPALEEVSPEGLVHPLSGLGRLLEEAAAFC